MITIPSIYNITPWTQQSLRETSCLEKQKKSDNKYRSLPCALIKIDGIVAVQLNLLAVSSDFFAVIVISLFHVN